MRRNPRYVVNADSPVARQRCDYSGFYFPRTEMVKRMHYHGGQLVWAGTWVARRFADKVNPQDRDIEIRALGPDPKPIFPIIPDETNDDGQAFPAYTLVTLPAPGYFPAGYDVDITAGGATFRIYDDGMGHWRVHSTNAVFDHTAPIGGSVDLGIFLPGV